MFYIQLFKIGLLGHYISSDSYYVYYIGKQKKTVTAGVTSFQSNEGKL